MISGPAMTVRVVMSTVTMTTTTPSSASTRRSRSTPSADVADDAVDVEVASGHGPLDALDPGVGEHELVAVLAHEDAVLGHAHLHGEAAVLAQVPVLAVHRREPLGLGDVEQRLDLLGLGVTAGMDRRDAGVDDLDAEARAARRSPG